MALFHALVLKISPKTDQCEQYFLSAGQATIFLQSIQFIFNIAEENVTYLIKQINVYVSFNVFVLD